MNKTPKKFREA
jgi:hypothetical protein